MFVNVYALGKTLAFASILAAGGTRKTDLNEALGGKIESVRKSSGL